MNNQTLEDKLADVIQGSQCIDGDVPIFFMAEQVEKIKQIFKDEGYTKKHQILYGTKYPDPRPCTTKSHFVADGKDGCECGYTADMREK